MEKVRASECSRVSLRDLIGSLGRGMNYFESVRVEVAVFCVCLKLLQEPQESSSYFLGISSSVEGFGKISTMWNLLVVVSICYRHLLFDYSF